MYRDSLKLNSERRSEISDEELLDDKEDFFNPEDDYDDHYDDEDDEPEEREYCD